MKCLLCGKPIGAGAGEEEKLSEWHSVCVKRFFGTSSIPSIDFSTGTFEELVSKTVSKGLTIPGVQKKLSLHLSGNKDARLTVVNYPTGFILKPQTEEYSQLPEFEHLAMGMADISGIKTVPHALIRNTESYAYITRRVDRVSHASGSSEMLAMEDFCQLSERLTVDKYRGSYEKCAKIVSSLSCHPGLDVSELFMRIVFSFIIGNSDMHLKNFSLIEDNPGSRNYHLSPSYDMLPVNVILPEDKEQLALTLRGKKRNLKRTDFMDYAISVGIPKTAADKMISKLCSLEHKYSKMCDDSLLSDTNKAEFQNLITTRIALLSK